MFGNLPIPHCTWTRTGAWRSKYEIQQHVFGGISRSRTNDFIFRINMYTTRQLCGIILLVRTFSITARGTLSKCQYKALGNIQKTISRPSDKVLWSIITFVQSSFSGVLTSKIATKVSVAHLGWWHSVASYYCMQITVKPLIMTDRFPNLYPFSSRIAVVFAQSIEVRF